MRIKESKSEVIRVTESENELLEYIRAEGESVLEEVDFEGVILEGGKLKRLVSMVDKSLGRRENDMRERVEMTDEEEEKLYKAIRENRSIVIEGPTASGRSTMVNSMLKCIKGERVIVLDDLEGCIEIKDGIEPKEGLTLSDMQDIRESLRKKPVRLVVDGIYGKEHLLGIKEALKSGMSVLVTDNPGFEERVDRRLELLGEEGVLEILKEQEGIMRVRIGKDEQGGNKIERIQYGW